MLKFYLGDDTLVKQPQGFGGLVYKKERNSFWGGFMYDTFGYVEGLNDLTFTEPLAVDFIKNEIRYNGILAKIRFRVLYGEKQLFGGLVYIPTLNWVNCCEVRVSLKDSSSINKIDSRGGSFYMVAPTQAIKLHAKYMDLNENVDGSVAWGVFVKDAFKQLISNISDGEVGFKSLFFSDGLGKNDFLTNGENIRNVKKGFNVGLELLFEALHKIYRLEGWIEDDCLRIEPRDYRGSIIYLGSVVKYTQFVDVEKIYSGVKVGYEKWQPEGRLKSDEFNSQREYVSKATIGKNELNLLSKLITSGYLIEETRRLQFSGVSEAEWKYDNDLFLIATKELVAERNEDWSNVSDIVSPRTVYNLKFSPLRMIHNWKDELSSSGECVMASSLGNSKMGALGKNDGIKKYLTEGMNVDFGHKLPYTANFEKTMSWEEFEGLKGWVEYDVCGLTITGKIEEVEWRMIGASERGIAKFKVKEY